MTTPITQSITLTVTVTVPTVDHVRARLQAMALGTSEIIFGVKVSRHEGESAHSADNYAIHAADTGMPMGYFAIGAAAPFIVEDATYLATVAAVAHGKATQA